VSTPSVSVSVHDAYTPEMRDRILERLRASMEDTAYALLTPAHLRALAAIDSPGAPVLSLYLQLSPDRRASGAWQTAFSSLSAATLKRIGDRRDRRAMKDELDRIEQTLHTELPALGRGAVFFACRPIGLWRQIAVSVPLPDGAHLSARPYVRPLVRTRDEHDRFVLALLSQERSRFFISQIGQVEEVFRVKGQRLRGMLTDRVARDRRDVLVTAAEKREVRVLAHVAELVLAQFEGRYLLVSGPPQLRSGTIESLAKDVQRRVGGEFTVDIQAGPSAVAVAAEPMQRAIEEREEVATVERMIEASPKVSAWGIRPTLDALYQRRVMTLAVDDVFDKPGARCGECSRLLEAISDSCPGCGSNAVEAVEDVVEMAIEQALEQRAALELVRSGVARRLMSERGPMAALLRG
jgi:peptide subunit release factor 1 (eRF1)